MKKVLFIVGLLMFTFCGSTSSAAERERHYSRSSYNISHGDTPGIYMISVFRPRGVLKIYSSESISVTNVTTVYGIPSALKLTQPVRVKALSPRDTLVIHTTVPIGMYLIEISVSPDKLLVLDVESPFDILQIDKQVVELKDSMYYLQDQDKAYVRFVEPLPSEILTKSEMGTLRIIYNKRLDKTHPIFYFRRYANQATQILSTHTELTGSYSWNIMPTNNVCHDWYLSVIIYDTEQHSQVTFYSDPFWVIHNLDWAGTCPLPIEYPNH